MTLPTYQPVIGLEVHAQLLTRTKAFCSCSTAWTHASNAHTCPVCLGLPGALPTVNAQAVRMAIRAGLALGCRIHLRSEFSRKHYFYPDLPKGYQITQFQNPIATRGKLLFPSESEGEINIRSIPIERVHIEEDAGKSITLADGRTGVDLNRAGVPLIEIVGAPQLRSGAEAALYLRQLRLTLMALGICDGNMAEGSLRCDVNVSIRRPGQRMGIRTEVKNVNSFRFVQKAIEYEVSRQAARIESGRPMIQETRGWDEEKGVTFSQRVKEEAHDYRYLPEPDLLPLVLAEQWVDEERSQLPELPIQKRQRFIQELGLSAASANVLTSHTAISDLFESTTSSGTNPLRASNFIVNQVLCDSSFDGLAASLPISAKQLSQLLSLVEHQTISGKQAKQVYALVKNSTASVLDVVRERGMFRLADEGKLQNYCEQVIAAHPRQAQAYQEGKRGLLGFFIGKVMKATGASADPRLTSTIVQRLLASGKWD